MFLGNESIDLKLTLVDSAQCFGWTEADCSTLATLSAGVVGLLMLLSVCRPLTKMRAALLGSVTAAFVGAVLLLGEIFCLTRLTYLECLALVALIAAAIGVLAGMTFLMRRRIARRG